MRRQHLSRVAALMFLMIVAAQFGTASAQARRGAALLTSPATIAPPGSTPGATSSSIRPASSVSAAINSAVAPTRAECFIYAVDQQGNRNAQLFTLDLRAKEVQPLGAPLKGYDVEGIAIHPTTRSLYATTSEHSRPPSQLFTVDGQTGTLTLVGATGFEDVADIAFRPTDATLWGWAENVGLIQVDTATGAGTLIFSSKLEVQGMTWSQDGAALYASAGQRLWVYDPASGTFARRASNLPKGTTALEVRPDGLLLGGIDKENTVDIFIYDPTAQRTVTRTSLSSSRYDPDDIAWSGTCGNPSPGGSADMITLVTVDNTRICTGDSVLVTVEARHPESPQGMVDISINGAWGSPRYLQFSGPPGPRLIQVVAATPEKHLDTEQVTVEIIACDEARETLDVTLQPNRFRQHVVDFVVANGAAFAGQSPAYVWDFGDGQTIQTDVPYAPHDYSEALGRDTPYSVFQATITLHRPGMPALTTHKTVTVWNMYGFNKQRGFLQPPVEAERQLRLSGGGFTANYSVENLEDELIRFTSRQLEYQLCAANQASIPQPPESLVIEIGPRQRSTLQLDVPASAITGDICGLALTLSGQSERGVPVYASAYFDTPPNPALAQPVDSQAFRQLLNDVVARGLVADPRHVTEEELYRLAREGKIVFPLPSTQTAHTVVETGAPKLAAVQPAAGEDIIGQPCAVGDPPPRPGVICVPSGKWTRPAPPRLANAYKGDALLTPGCGLIGALLSQVSPPQHFSHSGLMVEDYYRLRHSTAVEDRYAEFKVLEGLAGLRADVVRYGWPGIITQSIDETFNGEDWLDPETGKLYSIKGFSANPQQCGEDLELISTTVVKPVPGADPTVRDRLRAAADAALGIEGHYRFFAYSNAAIATDRSFDAPAGLTWTTPEGEHYNPSIATVCSSFIWHALKTVGITLEGTVLEEEDVVQGAWRDGETMDGLYYYTEAERRAGAYHLFQSVYDLAAEEAGFLGDVGEFFGGALTRIGNQVTNCFGFDSCGATDQQRWKNPGPGRAVSPDNILFWDSPAQGGVYGYNEPIAYRGSEYIQLSRWAPSPDTGTVTGRVLYQGQPVAGASVRVAGLELVTGPDGSFADNLVPAGRYEIVAAKTVDGVVLETRAEVTIVAGATTTIDLVLQPLPDYFRRLTITGSAFIVDDEFFEDETGRLDINETRNLDPFNRRTEFQLNKCVGGEVRIEIDVRLRLEDDNSSVAVTGEARMYEGTSCSTDEREDSETFALNLAPGASQSVRIHLDNTEFAGGDTADIEFVVLNGRQTVAIVADGTTERGQSQAHSISSIEPSRFE